VQLTKHKHSCVRFDDGDRTLVIDPGSFSDVAAALDGADAVLVTHEHFDHLDEDPVRAALKADPRLRLWAPGSVAAKFAEFDEQVVTVGAGQSFDAAGFAVRTFGGQHAVIHPLVPMVANVGYLVDGAVYHPGDSFVVPPVAVSTLLLPSTAPWSKLSEVIDFAISVRAARAYPIHDFMVNDAYAGILQRVLAPIVEQFGVEFGAFEATVTG
jgi:L-ascorbate metabolism protein UlaG (beta-lactamase superfamily)